MIPPLVLDCECCGRPFLAHIATIDFDDDIICPACDVPHHPESLDGIAAEIFGLAKDMAAGYLKIYGNSPFTKD